MTIEEVKFWVDNVFDSYDDKLNKDEIVEAKRIVNMSLDAMAIKALEQQPCEDWHDVPSDEMTLEQARQAVKDLRKKLAEYLEQKPCEDAVSRQAVLNIIMPYCQDDNGSVENTCDLRNALDDIESLPPVIPQKKTGHRRLINSEWIDFLTEQFDISRTSAKEMLHAMMSVKREDNFKKQFNGRK